MTMRAQASGVTRSRARSVALAGAAVVSCYGMTHAAADEPGPDALPITVVAVQTEDAYDQAEALTKALRSAVRGSRGWSLGEGDYALEVLTLSLKCTDPPDTSCESRIADQIKADRFIWGVLRKQGADVVGDAHLWVRGQGSKKVDLRYSANLTEPADDSLHKVATDSIERLTGGPPKGGVVVKAANVAGQVFVDGVAAGALTAGQGTFSVPSGPHTVVVKAQGYSDAQAPVIVHPQATSQVVLTPIPLPPETQSNARKIGGIVGIGAGLALVGVGVFSSVKVKGVQDDERFVAYRKTINSDKDTCETAGGLTDAESVYVNDRCGQAKTFELMQAVFYGLGAVAGGAGIYLLATSGSSSPPPPATGLTVTPAVGPGSGSLDLSYTW